MRKDIFYFIKEGVEGIIVVIELFLVFVFGFFVFVKIL